MTVKWRGKPVFIRNRTEAEISSAMECDVGSLRDVETDEERRKEDPTWLVVLGICTHLGCVPLANAGDWGGWFCPCESVYNYIHVVIAYLNSNMLNINQFIQFFFNILYQLL